MRGKNPAGYLSVWFDRFICALAQLSGYIIIFVTLAMSSDVVARYFLGSPMAWVFNVSQHLLAYSVFFAAAWVLKEGGHVKIDLVEVRLTQRQGDFLRFITSLLSLVACIVLLGSGVKEVLVSFRWGTIFPGPPPVPEYLTLGVIPFGTLLLVIQFGRDCWKFMNKLRRVS